MTENAGHEFAGNEFDAREIDGREIGGKNKINYVTMQCAILFKTSAKHKSHQQSKLYAYNMHMYIMLKCIKYYENIYLKLATGEQLKAEVY